jgi:hypothetical protein
MALFFDTPWFDARLTERGLDRGALANAAGLSREELHCLIVNEREATAAELTAFAALLGADIVEITIRSGVSVRTPPEQANPTARLDDLDARLDRIDKWLEAASSGEDLPAEEGSPSLLKAVGKR